MGIADEKLALACKHLAKVQVAWLDPVDWADLSLYAFFALENAVVAAATHVGVPWKATHPDKVEAARILHSQQSLPEIAELLKELNELRKSESYGDISPPRSYSAEEIATAVENYVEHVAQRIEGQ